MSLVINLLMNGYLMCYVALDVVLLDLINPDILSYKKYLLFAPLFVYPAVLPVRVNI